jgi:hypothetical protein
MQEVTAHLREYWQNGSLRQEDKKELVRCLIEQVFLKKEDKLIRAQVGWYGGAVSELEIPKYIFSTPHLFHRISMLAKTQTDREIAETLNREGTLTAKNKEWNQRRVMDFRLTNEIPSGFTKTPELRIADNDYLTSAEAAERLGVTQGTIQRWYKLGIVSGKHVGEQSRLWIFVNEEVEYRLKGGAKPDARMVSIKRLSREQRKNWEQIVVGAQSQGDQIYRLRRGSRESFYILPASISKLGNETSERDKLLT